VEIKGIVLKHHESLFLEGGDIVYQAISYVNFPGGYFLQTSDGAKDNGLFTSFFGSDMLTKKHWSLKVLNKGQ